MSADVPNQTAQPGITPPKSSRHRRRLQRAAFTLSVVLITYLLVAYLILPALWEHYEHQPSLAEAPKTTETGSNIPGDPLNVGLVGGETDVVAAFHAAGWHPADKITFRSSLKIADSVLLGRSYLDAPVSSLYLFGRKQDLAFEFPAGKSPKRRHHVRLWRDDKPADGGRPFWLGAATFDQSVGISHFTGQITHHISPDVDAERDKVIGDLERAGFVTRTYQVTGVGSTLLGRNGGGDWYYTDGELTVGVLKPLDAPQVKVVAHLTNPPSVRWKNRAWRWLRRWLP